MDFKTMLVGGGVQAALTGVLAFLTAVLALETRRMAKGQALQRRPQVIVSLRNDEDVQTNAIELVLSNVGGGVAWNVRFEAEPDEWFISDSKRTGAAVAFSKKGISEITALKPGEEIAVFLGMFWDFSVKEFEFSVSYDRAGVFRRRQSSTFSWNLDAFEGRGRLNRPDQKLENSLVGIERSLERISANLAKVAAYRDLNGSRDLEK